MLHYRHLNGDIKEVREKSPEAKFYQNSSSWTLIDLEKRDREDIENIDNESAISQLNKRELYQIARERHLNVTEKHTKSELIAAIEEKAKVSISGNNVILEFTDNII